MWDANSHIHNMCDDICIKVLRYRNNDKLISFSLKNYTVLFLRILLPRLDYQNRLLENYKIFEIMSGDNI